MRKLFANGAFVVLLMMFGFTTKVNSQTIELTDVRRREFRGVSEIKNSITNKIEGYYCFYVNEKEGKGMVNFTLNIFDPDLKLIKQTPMTISKNSTVDGSEFNGNFFLFAFNDPQKKKLTYISVDKQGNIIETKGIEERKKYLTTADVFPAGEEAFFIVKPIKEKKYGYSIEKVDKNLNSKWVKEYMPDKGYYAVESIEVTGDRALIIHEERPSLLSRKAKGRLICLSNNDGNEIFSYPLYDGENTAMPSKFLIDREGNIVTGGMYFEGEKWAATNSDGIFFLKLSSSGEKLAFKTESWKDGIQQIIKDGSKKTFSISSKPKVLFHEIIQQENGEYQVIGETFKKSYQAISSKLKDIITGRYIGNIGTNSDKPCTFEVMDFIVFQYGKEGQMNNINMVEKEHTKISCYSPFNGMGGLRLATYVKLFGFFNFKFLSQLKEGSNKMYLVSANFEKDPYVGVIDIDSSKELTMQRIEIDKKTVKNGLFGVMDSKPGRLAMYFYSPKEKKVVIYLQKVEV